MKVTIVGRDIKKIEEKAIKHGFEIIHPLIAVQPKPPALPDIIISNGGDGSLLGAERDFPGIPKLGLRDSRTSLKHEHTDVDFAFTQLKQGKCIERLGKMG